MKRTKGIVTRIELRRSKGTFTTPVNYTVLSALKLDDLLDIRKMVKDIVEIKRDTAGQSNKARLRIGQIVLINHNAHDGETFKILKLNPKKAVLQSLAEQHKRYSVPYNMIET